MLTRRRQPLILLLALQGVIGLLTLARSVAGDSAPAVFDGWAPPLIGVTATAPRVRFGIGAVLDGSFQAAAQAWVADHVTQRAAIIRSFDQLLWDGFGDSYMAGGSLVRGKGGALFEQSYILSYCGIAPATDAAALPGFARRLRAAQDWFTRHGKTMVYYIAPTKTGWFPDRIPDRFPCSPDKGAVALRNAVLTAFDQAGVAYVDGPRALEEQRGHVPIALFPRNGIHWNWLGSAIGTEALLAKLRALGLTGLPALTYDIGVSPDETGQDSDLATLLNLLWLPPGDPAPTVTVRPPAGPGTLRLAAVNDSFLHYLPMVLLDSGHVFASETVFGYVTGDQRLYKDGQIHLIKADPAAIVKTLRASDVVVVEEIENRVGGPLSRKFLDMMDAVIAQDPAQPRCVRMDGAIPIGPAIVTDYSVIAKSLATKQSRAVNPIPIDEVLDCRVSTLLAMTAKLGECFDYMQSCPGGSSLPNRPASSVRP